jgi:hypothetical protein
MADLRDVTLPLITPIYVRSIPNASDEAVFRLGQHLAAGIVELQRDPRVCIGYMVTNEPGAREAALSLMSDETKRTELEVMAQVIESAAPGRRKAGEADKQRLYPHVFKHAESLVGDDIAELENIGKPGSDPTKCCRAILGFYSGVVRLPQKDAALLIRDLMAK